MKFSWELDKNCNHKSVICSTRTKYVCTFLYANAHDACTIHDVWPSMGVFVYNFQGHMAGFVLSIYLGIVFSLLF
jgi:hypothetical protein